MKQATKQQVEKALAIISKVVAERKSCGFPSLVDELIAEVAEVRGLDAAVLGEYYYGILALED